MYSLLPPFWKGVYFKRTEFASIGNKFFPFQSTSLFWRGLMCRTPNSTKWPKMSLNPNTNTIIVSLVKMAKHLLSVSSPLNLLPFTFQFQVALKSEQRWHFFSDEDSTTDAGTIRNSLITGTFCCVQNYICCCREVLYIRNKYKVTLNPNFYNFLIEFSR